MEHCWTYRAAPEKRSKWLGLCRFDNGAEKDPQIAVCDLDNASLQLFSEEGHFLHQIIPPFSNWRPCAVTQGIDHSIAVCDWSIGCLRLLIMDYRPSYQRSEVLGTSYLRKPYDVAMTTVGNWIVADEDDVVLLNPFGALITRIDLSKSITNGKKWTPRHVTTDDQQRIYVSDPSAGLIVVFDAAGRFIRQIDGEHLRHPSGMLINDLDQLLVCDQGHACVSLFDQRGQFLYDVINRDKTPMHIYDDDQRPIKDWIPVSLTSTTSGQVCLAAAYGSEFVIQCFAYDFMPSSARSAHK